MSRGLALALTAAAGVLVAMQGPINGRLGGQIGKLPAAAVSFTVGTVFLIAVVFISGDGFGKLAHVSLPWVYFIGGLLGAGYVTTIIYTVGTIGAGGVTAATIAGQLTTAVALDQFGAFNLPQQSITVAKVAGVALLAAGAYLIVAVD